MVRRQAVLAFLALATGVGCSTRNTGGLTRQDPPLAKENLSKTRIISQLNKNASTIKSLKATPSIVVAADGYQGKLSARMALERPRDFRLEIKSLAHTQADIGSNDKGFWFWVNDKKDPSIYVCDYEHLNTSPLTVTMQPEWIMEAMGLREISEREAATISAKPGNTPGQLVFTQLRSDPKGGTLTKVTVVDETSGEILEHRLYSGAETELLAKATIRGYQQIKMGATDEDPTGSTVVIPAKMRLEWIVEKFSLDITMGSTQVNPRFPKEQRAALFTEPPISGVTRKDLAQRDTPPANSSRVYESLPRSSVRLGKPEAVPMNVEGAVRSTGRPRPIPADVDSSTVDPTGVVGAPMPQGVDTDAVQASGRRSWRPIEQ